MIASVELQVVSRLLTSEDQNEIDTLLSFGDEYYTLLNKQIAFIQHHAAKYGTTPDVFTFRSEFPDCELVEVSESLEYLVNEMRKNRQHIILLEMVDKLSRLESGDVVEAWNYIGSQCDLASELNESKPMNIVAQAQERADQVLEYSKQQRIPTGFPEIDKIMYGGLSTVEELVVIIARTNSGKSWICTKMMETAQGNGFPVLYYSPEMQSSYLATRFDTWRAHFKNNELFTGKYDDAYVQYIKDLPNEETPALVVEDKDMPDGVSVRTLTPLIRRYGIRLLIIDGLSYMKDDEKSVKDYDKYKHICTSLFNMSKKFGCAVVVTMQANRATLESKDENGDPFPSIYNAEGSDHPARIATQVFAVRQIFETHTLDIRLEKSRSASNTKPVVSYVWEVNTGHVQHVEDGSVVSAEQPAQQFEAQPIHVTDRSNVPAESFDEFDDDDDAGVAF